MKKIYLCILLISLIVGSCRYRAFLKYFHASKTTHSPHFSKWDRFVGSNFNPLRSCYNVTCYDWHVDVEPEKKSISAVMKIYFQMKSPQDTVIFDFERHMKIDKVSANVPLKKWSRKKDLLFFVFSKDVKSSEKVVLEIAYHGTPINILKYSTISWKKDKNNKPWVSTITEGLGPHHMIPCNILLNDEPDSCFIRVRAPKGLVAVANGRLDSISERTEGNTYHWSVKNPINVYSVSFNVGDYVRLEKDYTDITGAQRRIEVYALGYNRQVADTFYDQVPGIMIAFERFYGQYPWWNDGCKFIETNIAYAAMEHQSGISMGMYYYNDYNRMNTTIAHELGHEWWGNSLTASDWGDLWLHEGFASYSEFLAVEAIYGKKGYNEIARYYASIPKNLRPVLKRYDVAYNSLVHDDDEDIYFKGAMLLHTLRRQLDDDALFFLTLKNIQTRFSKSNISTEQFIGQFNAGVQKNFTPFFDVYLKQIAPPILEYSVQLSDSVSSVIKYKWKNVLPKDFFMKIPLHFGEKIVTIYPTETWQEVVIPAKGEVIFDRAEFGYLVPEKIK